MFAAVLTTLLFSLSAIFGRRLSHALSGPPANLGRLGLAAALTGIWSHLFGFGLQGRASAMLFLSGCVGFGLGDLAMFESYRRIGARRTVVLIQCLAAPFGTVGEWLWLGHAPTPAQAVYACVILAGVGLALLPVRPQTPVEEGAGAGIFFGVAAAFGQAGGAVLSRKAYALAAATGHPFHPTFGDGVNAAYQRMLGGIVVSALCCAYGRFLLGQWPPLKHWKRGWPWMVGHALAGPTAGVACFQWALLLQPANIVLPIVATTPLAVLPLAHFFEGERVTRRAVLGSGIAVTGVVALVLAS